MEENLRNCVSFLCCFKLDFLWLSLGEKHSELLWISAECFKSLKKDQVTEQPVDFMWPRNSSCLHRCFPDISSSMYYFTFLELSCLSFHYLLSYLSIIWEHCIVTIALMLIHSLPSFFILPSLTAFPAMQENTCWHEEFFLPVMFCWFWFFFHLLVLFCFFFNRKKVFFSVTWHMWKGWARKKRWILQWAEAEGSVLGY